MAGSARPGGNGTLALTWLLAASLSPAAIALAQTAPPAAPHGPAAAQATPAASVPATPAQSVPATPAPAPQAKGLFPAQPPPADKPGFIYAFGRWWDSTHGGADGAAQATQDALNKAAEATKSAAAAIMRLPAARFIEVHERCGLAPNGAPDCRSAATVACRAKGFNAGSPVNVQSSENCPPAVWMSGRQPAAGECPQETVVLMAACQ
jgi:hypothetical protein